MNVKADYTINVGGRLMDVSKPRVMGILNVTPDSFYAVSRKQDEAEIAERVRRIAAEGAAVIDVGGCSTRPGGTVATEEEEMARLRRGLTILRREQPDAVVSVDTFRPDVARMAVEEYGVAIVNDVSGGADAEMFRMVARLGVPYILMSTKATLREMMVSFAREVQALRDLGAKDIILDPGFGFGKTLEQNYDILMNLDKLQVMGLPILAGMSRKRMIYNLLATDPAGALNGTTAVNTIAVVKGATILRVHDVREAVEVCRIAGEALMRHADNKKL